MLSVNQKIRQIFYLTFLLSFYAARCEVSRPGISCTLNLYIPESLTTKNSDYGTGQHFFVLKISPIPPEGSSTEEGKRNFCQIEEMIEPPENSQLNRFITFSNESLKVMKRGFKKFVTCPNSNVVLFRNLPKLMAAYPYGPQENWTLGLQLKCLSDDPLDMKFSGEIPFSSMGVEFGSSLDSNSNKSNSGDRQELKAKRWIQVEFPKRFRTGNLEDYRGDYEFYTTENSLLQKFIQIKFESERGRKLTGILTGKKENVMSLKINDGFAVCESANTSIELSNIKGENPSETSLMKSCLNSSKSCGNKKVGTFCLQKEFCKKIERIYQNGFILCSDGKTTQERFYYTDLLMCERFDFVNLTNVIQLRRDDGNFVTEIKTSQCNLTVPNSTISIFNFQNYSFECLFLPYIILPNILWEVIYENGTHLLGQGEDQTINTETFMREGESETDVLKIEIKSAKMKLTATEGMRELRCSGLVWNSSSIVTASINLKWEKSTAPSFQLDQIEKIEVKEGRAIKLNCDLKEPARPDPTFSWFKNDKEILVSNDLCANISNDSENMGFRSIFMTCPATTSHHSGLYTCEASNFLKSSRKSFEVTILKDQSVWIYLGCAGIILVGFAIALFIIQRKYREQQNRLTELEIQNFMTGDTTKVNSNDYAHIHAHNLPYNKDYEVDWSLVILDDEKLGEGIHGIVQKASIGGKIVAAKTIRPGSDKPVMMALLAELKIMMYLGRHGNVVELVGANTTSLEKGLAYVFVDFCPLGSLDSFLKKHRKDFNFINGPAGGVNASVDNEGTERRLTLWDLNNFSFQIASGMEYLASRMVIHGDLATRNVLLKSLTEIKITDFGLSRQLLNCTQYVKKQQVPLPFRWMAIESLKDLIFTTSSDVWSYGVTVWEIFSLAQNPYGGMSWTLDFVKNLEEDMRLGKPRLASHDTYQILLDCWDVFPEQRPTFNTLENYFSAKL